MDYDWRENETRYVPACPGGRIAAGTACAWQRYRPCIRSRPVTEQRARRRPALSANISETPAFLEISVEGAETSGTDGQDGCPAGGGRGGNREPEGERSFSAGDGGGSRGRGAPIRKYRQRPRGASSRPNTNGASCVRPRRRAPRGDRGVAQARGTVQLDLITWRRQRERGELAGIRVSAADARRKR